MATHNFYLPQPFITSLILSGLFLVYYFCHIPIHILYLLSAYILHWSRDDLLPVFKKLSFSISTSLEYIPTNTIKCSIFYQAIVCTITIKIKKVLNVYLFLIFYFSSLIDYEKPFFYIHSLNIKYRHVYF